MATGNGAITLKLSSTDLGLKDRTDTDRKYFSWRFQKKRIIEYTLELLK